MLSKVENEMITRVGPGTPAGEMLRRYWWPVGFSEHVKEKGSPIKATLLGEEFVLFRVSRKSTEKQRCTWIAKHKGFLAPQSRPLLGRQ